MEFIVLIATGFLSVILCLFGIKLMRVFNALAATVAGLGLGYVGAQIAGVDLKTQWIIMAVSAAVLAILAACLKKLGAFLFCLVGVTGMLFLIARPDNMLLYAVFGGLGMLFAIAAMNWLDPIFILATAFVGGIGIGKTILEFVEVDSIPIMIAVYAVPVLVGGLVQFILKSREIGRKEAKHSEEVKKENSMENEVEQARSLFDENLLETEESESELEELES